MKLEIDHIQLSAPIGCEGEARSFFGYLLGLKERPKIGRFAHRGGVWFMIGEQELHVGIDVNFSPAKKAHVAFKLDSIDQLSRLAQRLEDRGHEVDWQEGLLEVKRFFSTDPWGNRLEFLAEAL